MMDTFRKTLLAGVGAVVVTTEKLEAALDELVQQGKVTSQEARRMAEKIAADGRREFDAMSRDFNERFRAASPGNDESAAERIAALEARIAELERKMAEKKSKTRRTPAS